MEILKLKNVIGSPETASVITSEMLGPLATLNLPLGQRLPSNWQAPKGYHLEKETIQNIPIERLTPEAGGNGKVVLMLHGGAFVWPLMDSNRELAVVYSQLTQGGEVINVDYRIAPTDRYPAALEDCITIYKYLLESGCKNDDILLMGESAGGNLVLALTLYLRDHNIPLPKGIISLSPVTELSNDLPSRRINFKNDILLGENGCALSDQNTKQDYRGMADVKIPYLSPLYGDYTGFPPLLLQAGTYEMLYDDSVKVAEKCEQVGVDVTFSSYYGMCHCFQEIFPELPESKLAWKEIITFINKYFIA